MDSRPALEETPCCFWRQQEAIRERRGKEMLENEDPWRQKGRQGESSLKGFRDNSWGCFTCQRLLEGLRLGSRTLPAVFLLTGECYFGLGRTACFAACGVRWAPSPGRGKNPLRNLNQKVAFHGEVNGDGEGGGHGYRGSHKPKAGSWSQKARS